MEISDPIRASSRGGIPEALAALNGPDAKDVELVRTIYADAPRVKIDAAVAIAHIYQETATELGPLSSVRWNRDLNPAGVGIPQDATQQPFAIGSGAEAARLYLVALNRLANTPADDAMLAAKLSAPARSWLETVWARHCAEARAAGATVKTIRDLCRHYNGANGEPHATWAWNPNAAVEIAAMGSRVFSTLVAGHPLVPIRKRILSRSAPNRPGAKLDRSRGALHVTVHETGDPNANASQEAAYLESADARSRSVSYHLTNDDVECWQMLPLDEIGWHAGDSCDDPDVDVGCFRSIALEICVRRGQNQAAAYDKAAQILARIVLKDPAFDWGSGATRGAFDDQHFDQHIRVSQENPPHDCPNGLRHETTPGWNWSTFMARIDYWLAALSTTTPAPEKPTPLPPRAGGGESLPVPGIPLPPGLTTAYLARRFAGNDAGVVELAGTAVRFDPNEPVSRAWLRKALATIPKGGTYEDGTFPALSGAVKRAGTKTNAPGVDWIFANGWTIPTFAATGKGKQ